LCHSEPGTATQAFAAWPDATGRTGGRPATQRLPATHTIISNFKQILDNKNLNKLIILEFYFVTCKVFVLYK